ncbi:MAG: METTL5 family protein [Candidatus Bathyarchaeota archaeon]|nr:METTL5 family protein [Candidatus Bathyarchaeota archaeon]
MGEPAQKRIIRKLDLERFLSTIKPHTTPKAHLEQYTTPPNVAANLLYLAAYNYGDIAGKRVLDLGCGTGRLALGAAFLGAASVVGIDLDKPTAKTAHENASALGFKEKTGWATGDIDAIAGSFDTVVQNPPFGVQKHAADRRFLSKALEVGNAVYSLHNHPYTDKHLIGKIKANNGLLQVAPSPFLQRFIEKHGGTIQATYALLMTIPHMFDFHTKAKQEIITDLYVIRN